MKKIKCRKPIIHSPQFEAKYHCKTCEGEEKDLIKNTICKSPMKCHNYFIQRGCKKCFEANLDNKER